MRSTGPVDVAGNFARGYQMADTIISKIHERNALGALAQNPDDPQALGTLWQANPTLANHFEERGIQRRKAAREAEELATTKRLGTLAAAGDTTGAYKGALGAGLLDVAKQYLDLDKEAQGRMEKVWGSIGPLAYTMRQMKDPEQRKALFQQALPILQSYGADPQKLASFDPTNDTALDAAIATSQKIGDLVSQRKPQEFNVGPGEARYERDPVTGEVRTIIAPNPGGQPFGAPASSGVGAVLSGAGLPSHVVAGFLGNFHTEVGYGGAKGDGGTASGIAQWRGDRQANFARVIGKPVEQASPEEQAKFVLWEMQNPEAAGMTTAQRDAILNAKSPGEAAELIDKFYERSSGEHRSRRVEAANRAGGGDPAKIRAQAQQAISAGADPAAVRARAASMGVTL